MVSDCRRSRPGSSTVGIRHRNTSSQPAMLVFSISLLSQSPWVKAFDTYCIGGREGNFMPLDHTTGLSSLELFSDDTLKDILAAFDASLGATGFTPERRRASVSRIAALRLPDLSINMGGTTSIGVTKGIDKAYSLKRLRDASGIPLVQIIFIDDAIFPGGNDYPAKQLGLPTVQDEEPDGTLAIIAGIVA
ncbi:hypothetical protein F4779DRAFT_624455 [Xylariaceae sp. FL0662B]|nr:hypothetical protein F4779DRAFT_624455 [Xylariaceae sp. FL0662B]